jgi:hypothetical protein
MKIRGFEFEDQPWFPETIRDYMTDYLRFLFHSFNLYRPVFPLLKEALVKANTNHILDLCSGSGGAMENIYENLKRTFNADIHITLTDLFPSLTVYEKIKQNTQGGISYLNTPVDATNVPLDVKGFRTIFSGFHHFDREKAKAVLRDAVNARQGIGIFDGGDRSIWMILLIVIVHPILLVLCTPFFTPFKISRLLFTYLIPIIPFCAVWDGVVSIVRLYSSDELLLLAHEVDRENYQWISGKLRNKFGLSIVYLIGYSIIENN